MYVCIYTYIHTYVCIYIYIRIYIYIYIHTHILGYIINIKKRKIDDLNTSFEESLVN